MHIPTSWEFALPEDAVVPTTLRLTNATKEDMSALLFLPPGSNVQQEGTKPLPLMMYVYGGPSVQLVADNQLESAAMIIPQILAKKGIAVAVVDNVMAVPNSLRTHAVAKKNMGHFEAKDYAHAAREICAAYSNVLDVNRVGVFGWSYGGYATLLCMSQASDFFKIGLAGAPVTLP